MCSSTKVSPYKEFEMSSKKTAGWVVMALSCLSIASAPVHAETKQNPPKQTGSETPGSKLESCENMLTLCQGFRRVLSEKVKALEGQVKALEGQVSTLKLQIGALEQKAALPACLNRYVWTHPTIASVNCSPFACGTKPYSCKHPCNSQLDCAPGLSCTADGYCLPLPKQH